MEMTLEEISFALKSVGDLNGLGNTMVTCVQTDSRLVRPGDLFVCLCGRRMDGHNFAGLAAKNGAAAVVSHHPMPDFKIPVLLVEDTLRGLGRLGRYWRMKKANMVIAVTGSAGKTTTKEMLSGVLGAGHLVGKNYKNWNNQIGLPLSILKFSGEEDFWILELGINCPADMDELGEIACPDQAVILNIGPCHLQGLGTLEGVAKSKCKILDHLQGPKKAFVCRDYPLLEQELGSRPHIKPVWFSCRGNPAGFNVEYLSSGHYQVREGEESITLRSLPGAEQYCENIGAVWALARQSGMEPDQIIKGLDTVNLPEQRFSVGNLGSWTIIDDTYNANPLSMIRAVRSARNLAGQKNLYLVIGDMKELGDTEIRAHQDLGREISKMDCRAVFFHGKNAGNVKTGLDGKVRNLFYEIRSPGHFKSILDRLGCPEGVVLFKGSRSQGMEKYVSCFREWGSGDPDHESER